MAPQDGANRIEAAVTDGWSSGP